jgi:hypothetical protein
MHQDPTVRAAAAATTANRTFKDEPSAHTDGVTVTLAADPDGTVRSTLLTAIIHRLRRLATASPALCLTGAMTTYRRKILEEVIRQVAAPTDYWSCIECGQINTPDVDACKKCRIIVPDLEQDLQKLIDLLNS